MALGWAQRRKFLYYTVAIIIGAVFLIFVYESLFTAPPTCFDKKQNGNEIGVDCGGSCSLVCPSATRAPAVLWARAYFGEMTEVSGDTGAKHLLGAHADAVAEIVADVAVHTDIDTPEALAALRQRMDGV